MRFALCPLPFEVAAGFSLRIRFQLFSEERNLKVAATSYYLLAPAFLLFPPLVTFDRLFRSNPQVELLHILVL